MALLLSKYTKNIKKYGTMHVFLEKKLVEMIFWFNKPLYKFIECKKSIEDFVGHTHKKVDVEDFGGVMFHNYFWAHYDKFGKCVQFTFYFGLYIIT
jgi:hypothetical protein